MLLTSIIFNIITKQYIIYLEEPPCADRSKPNFKQCKCEDGTVIHHKGVKKHKVAQAAVVHFNFRARSTFPVPVCTVPHGHWVNKANNQQD